EYRDSESRMVVTSYGRVLFWTTDLAGEKVPCVKRYHSVSHITSHSLDLLHSSHIHYMRGRTLDFPCIQGACCFTSRWRASLRLSFGSQYAPAAISTFNTASAGFNSTIKPTLKPNATLDTYWKTGFVAIAGCLQRCAAKFANMERPEYSQGYAGTPFTVEIETGGSPFGNDEYHQKENIFRDLFDIQRQILGFRARFVTKKKGEMAAPVFVDPSKAGGAEQKVADAVGSDSFKPTNVSAAPFGLAFMSNLVESDPTHAGEYFTVDMQDVPLTDGERVHVDPQLLPLMEGERVGEWCLPTCPPPPPSFICHGCGATVEAITSEPTGSFSLLQRLFPCCCKRRQYGAIVFTTHRIANIFMEGRSKTQGHKYAFAVDAYFLDGVKSGFSTHIPMNPRQRRKGNKQAPMFVNRQAYLHTKYGYLQVSPSPQHRLNCCGCPIGQTMDDDRRAEVVLRAVTRISATPMLPPPRVPETAELVNE
ncbi:unnamed protein product, partial [Symbiodinium sp. KB8]